ncbi:HAD-IA family hydrolase [Oceanibium sediminis]|uniref:HAD-IA family hydrolase n=1 Tax=Oceanibium sediminis TaxID=2026339 RepID=UPI000DD4C594|nr:HAD-IA family hydrolase [Oceanibium sediminis]
MRSVIFDLDGTLADTSADLIAAANACFATPQLDPLADRAVAFAGGRAMLRLGHTRAGTPLPEAEVDAAYDRFLDVYAEGMDNQTFLYDGAMQAVDTLASRGWLVGICTNKPHHLAEDLMTRLGVRDRFGALIGAGHLPVKKPDPRHLLETIAALGGDPAQSALIGDTHTDRDAARNAGVVSVLVTFGPEGDGVAALEPEALLSDYNELPDMMERFFPG